MALLEVRDLTVELPTLDGAVRAVTSLSYALDQGEMLAIVGESGSGKTVSALALMGLLPGAVVHGSAFLDGRDLLAMSEGELRAVRGPGLAMVFQDPLSALHPSYRVGWQIAEAVRAHEPGVSRNDARSRAVDLLRLVGISDPGQRADDYPHQYSGGMRQRATIAMAVALNPKLLIADEPTTALDVTVQAQILELVGRLQAELGTAVILITHDLRVVADLADRVLVMYAGRAMEMSELAELVRHPAHPYTEGLLASLPVSGKHGGRLQPIPGQPPSLINLPSGCPFHPRCRYRLDRCATELPELTAMGGGAGHLTACWLWDTPEQTGQALDVAVTPDPDR